MTNHGHGLCHCLVLPECLTHFLLLKAITVLRGLTVMGFDRRNNVYYVIGKNNIFVMAMKKDRYYPFTYEISELE